MYYTNVDQNDVLTTRSETYSFSGVEHGRRVENPTRENSHIWRPELPFGEDVEK